MATPSTALALRSRGRSRSRQPRSARPRAPPPTSTTGRRPRICGFCASDPAGQLMHAERPCDWLDAKPPLECSNCADHRALNPVSAAAHVCVVRGKALLYRKYSPHHPARYHHAVSPVTGLSTAGAALCCVKCAADGRVAACDVDPILGYQCSRCKASDNCTLPDGRLMDNKPNLRQGVTRWFRHACDGCAQLAAGRSAGRLATGPCSWLADRTAWDAPCERCRANNLICLASGMVAALPAAITIPETWRPRSFIALGWAELRPNTVWRKACLNCQRDRNHCRASVAAPHSACGRCTGMGLDCVDAAGTAYPIFDLSQVGFGNFLPFAACRRCVAQGRNCDRQRPCDSCTAADEEHLCDNAFVKTEAGKKRMANCLPGRLAPRPGPLYYLAHGYGAGGVDDVKDGSKMEHWIGPVAEVYVMPGVSYHEGSLTREVARQREAMVPRWCAPPHAAPGTPLATKAASELTAGDIADMVRQVWPEAVLMNTLEDFAEQQQRAVLNKSHYQFNTPVGTDDPPTAADLAAAADADPNFVPRPIVRVVQALPVVNAAASEEEDGEEEEDEESYDDEEGEEEDGEDGQEGEQAGQAGQPEQVEQADNASDVPVVPQPAAAPSPPGVTLQQLMRPVSAQPPAQPRQPDAIHPPVPSEISVSQAVQVAADATGIAAPAPIDPALQPWTPAAPTPSTRWIHLNPLHASTSAVLGPRSSATSTGVPLRLPFTLSISYLQSSCPVRDVLRSLPEPNPITTDTTTETPSRCEESGESEDAYMTCGASVPSSAVCADTHHQRAQFVCDNCAAHSAQLLVDPRHSPLLADEVLAMRSYLCSVCTARVGASRTAMLIMCEAGVNTVYGGFPLDSDSDVVMTPHDGGPVHFFHQTRPLTGCACGAKMFRTRQCLFHRLENARAVLAQVAAVRGGASRRVWRASARAASRRRMMRSSKNKRCIRGCASRAGGGW